MPLVEVLRPWSWPRAAALTLITIGVAGCSAESGRFNDNPNARVETTSSIPAAHPAPAGQVQSQPLPPVNAQAAPPPMAARPDTVAANQGMAGGGRGMASYTPNTPGGAPMPAAEVTGSVAALRPAPTGHWSWEGGTPVTVAPGDTVEGISRRHGVPGSAIMQANNLTPPGAIHPGQQLVIPRYVTSPVANAAPPTRAVMPPPAKPLAVRSAASSPVGNPGVHVVARGETLSKISRLYGKSLADIAKANNIQPSAKLSVGDRLVIPGVRTAQAAPKPGPAIAQAKPALAPAAKEPAGEPVQTASLVAPVAEAPIAKDAVKSAEATGSLPKFRWPANGRVIAGFGSSANGQQNDGINIAVPENTPVKAAEDGVVAYAGSELKGYGNLVLVRHPNGYVTAYAHAAELLVKRGDQVKRGQVIARSGQTGNVNAPQLHFEIRKGALPLDPMKFLTGA
jgi:murein DD-endopeptidase MepM/ murein hydrolase activator NlpD